MTSDALYLYDLFKIQREVLVTDLIKGGLNYFKFDKFSFSAWAIKEFIDAVDSLSLIDDMVTVATMREILRMQMTEYSNYYNVDSKKHIRYKYALDMLTDLYKITGGWVYDE